MVMYKRTRGLGGGVRISYRASMVTG
jgi:hypothetical protein